jgi:uncharacterized integral membrane protein
MNYRTITNSAVGAIVISILLFFIATALKSFGYLESIPWWGIMIPLILPYILGVAIAVIAMIVASIYRFTSRKKTD